MKSGVRALGVAESYRGDERSTLSGAVVRASRVVDGFGFGDCAVGGTDATASVAALFDELGRADVRYVLVAGLALAWYNVVDLHAIADATDRPVISVTFEASEGLEPSLREEFAGDALAERLATYRAQPPRRPVDVGDERVFVRAAGCDDETAAEVVRAFTPEGGRPEPLRVARLAARGADRWRRPEG
ncbi:MAG: DUF99 family protein [Halobacteriaceae archaeon]